MVDSIEKGVGGSRKIDLPAAATAEQIKLARWIENLAMEIDRNSIEVPALSDLSANLDQIAREGFDKDNPVDVGITTQRVEEVRAKAAEIFRAAPPRSSAGATRVQGIYEVHSADPEDRGLIFGIPPDLALLSPPADQMALKAAIDDTLLTLNLIFPEQSNKILKARFKEYRQKLINLARIGLSGASVFPSVASAALETLRSEIVAREAGRVKNDYMIWLGLYAIAGGAVATGAYLWVRLHPGRVPALDYFANFLVLWAGCMLGTWLSFGTRRVFLKFEDLGRLNTDLLYPWMRLIFAGCLTLVLGLVFATEMINIQIGNLSTARLLQTELFALVVGIFCGLSEQALPGAVSQKAAQFFSEFEKKGGTPQVGAPKGQ